MSIYEKAQFIIMIQGPTAAATVNEAERVKKLYLNRASVSRPIPHTKRYGWWVCYVDVYPPTDTGLIVEVDPDKLEPRRCRSRPLRRQRIDRRGSLGA